MPVEDSLLNSAESMTVPARHEHIESWGRIPTVRKSEVLTALWKNEFVTLLQSHRTGSVLPIGLRKSYGDSCLNNENTVIVMQQCNRLIAFDKDLGILRCEAGVSFAQILDIIVAHGWFLPVTPGTKYITVGGAIANDIHGKNHHRSGTFGSHIQRFELIRSDGHVYECSPTDNHELFAATIGGLGLTGIISWAEFTLCKIPSDFISQTSFRYANIDEYLEHSRANDAKYDYIVSWIDCTQDGSQLGRGVFMGGDFTEVEQENSKHIPSSKPALTMMIDAPSFVLNKYSISLFNQLYFHAAPKRATTKILHYNPFFYPLDSIHQWNKMYGRSGFYQYQFVVPFETARPALHEVLHRTTLDGSASFLSVLKNFGNHQSPGMLSFPKEGVTLAMDFKNNGIQTLRLLDSLDDIIREHDGRLYPAKDARMSGDDFRSWYPAWERFSAFVDPQFSSMFWRRVMQ